MQDRIEPPVLISRLMTFVFASSLVVLGALGVTLYKMFPLNRPQVFFLMTQLRSDVDIRLTEMPPADENLEIYKRMFIREYIRARNEVMPNMNVMRRKWNNSDDGVVRAWSSPDVYQAFTETGMWNAIMNDIPDFKFSCPVEFQTGAIAPRTDDTYAVSFTYYCTNSDRQGTTKDYTIVLKLEMDDGATVRWADRLNNPLGIRVTEYTVESDNGDPLNTGYLD